MTYDAIFDERKEEEGSNVVGEQNQEQEQNNTNTNTSNMIGTTTPAITTSSAGGYQNAGLLSMQRRLLNKSMMDSRADSRIDDNNDTNHRDNNNYNNSNNNSVDGNTTIGSTNSRRNTNSNTDSGTTSNNIVPLPRFILRDLPYSQSTNSVQVRHNYSFFKIYKLIQHDWFHVILRLPTFTSLFILISIWTLFLVIWAGFYVWVDRSNLSAECGLGVNGSSITFFGAFAFSLQTSTTVGYTLPSGSNSLFNKCPGIQITIYAQLVVTMMYNAFIFAFFYTRIGKCDSRGTQILFSSKAIVSIVDGQVRFQIRMYDIDAINPVVEPSIRMYVVTKTQPVPKRIRIIQPNDEFGSMLFLSLPAVASHHIDIYSLLHPPRVTPINPCGLTLRQADSAVSSRLEVVCPICGDPFGTYDRWVCHMQYMTIVEQQRLRRNQTTSSTSTSPSNRSINATTSNTNQPSKRSSHSDVPKSQYLSAPPEFTTTTTDIMLLKKHFEQEVSEVICIIEGIEPISSGSFSSIQSYKLDDIVFQEGARFRPCIASVIGRNNKETIRIDLDRFHEIDNVVTSPRRRHERISQRSVRGHDGIFFQMQKSKSKKGQFIS